MQLQEFLNCPGAQSWRRIDWETAEVVPGIVPGTWFLTVSGQTSTGGMRVELQPLVYIVCPDYWEIELIAMKLGGVAPDVLTPFHLTIPLVSATGYKGTRLVGATKSEQWDLSAAARKMESRASSDSPTGSRAIARLPPIARPPAFWA